MFEGVILVVGTVVVLVHATLSQRRRFEELFEDVDDELEMSRRIGVEMGVGWVPLALSVFVIVVFLLGIGVLLQLMR